MPSGVFGETYNLKDNLKEGGGVFGGAGCEKKVGESLRGKAGSNVMLVSEVVSLWMWGVE